MNGAATFLTIGIFLDYDMVLNGIIYGGYRPNDCVNQIQNGTIGN